MRYPVKPDRFCLASMRPMVLLIVALMPLPGMPASASPAQQICDLPASATSYESLGLSFWKYPTYVVSVKQNSSIRFATKVLSVDFPALKSKVQFFGLNPVIDASGGGKTGLVACLHYKDANGADVTASYDNFDYEGGMSPEIAGMFTVNLGRSIGNTLVLIERISVEVPHESSGYLYSVAFFSAKNLLEGKGGYEWGELTRLEEKFSPSPTVGFDGVTEGEMRTYPYKTKAEVLQRLKDMGYLP